LSYGHSVRLVPPLLFKIVESFAFCHSLWVAIFKVDVTIKIAIPAIITIGHVGVSSILAKSIPKSEEKDSNKMRKITE